MCFPVSYAGFFATHNNLFFNISFLYVCLPPLKNDDRSELLCHDILMLNEYIKKSIGTISRPRLSGKVAAIAVGRGKREQKRKNENSVSKNPK